MLLYTEKISAETSKCVLMGRPVIFLSFQPTYVGWQNRILEIIEKLTIVSFQDQIKSGIYQDLKKTRESIFFTY